MIFRNTQIDLKTKLTFAVAAMAVIAFLVFSFVYRNFVHQTTLKELKTEMAIVARSHAKALESELQKFSFLPFALSENPYVYEAMAPNKPDDQQIQYLNEKLMSFSQRTGAPYIYIVDNTGATIASSNYAQEDSFVGRRYEFRPYFKLAMTQGSAEYFAKGERTGKAGLFFARRIDQKDRHLGVVVVKVEFENIVNLWKEPNSSTFVTNNDGIILFSSDKSLNYSTLHPLSQSRRDEIRNTMQFGDEQLNSSALKIDDNALSLDSLGRESVTTSLEIPELQWRIYRMVQTAPALKAADLEIQLRLLGAGALFAVLSLFGIWRISLQHQRAQATKFLKTEVFRQTKALSNTNRQLELEIEAREKINERFRNAREELAQANRLGSIGAITTSVAHEINQPVAAIRAFAENAVKLLNRKEFDRVRENLSSIVDLTSRIGAITVELRRYARRGSQTITRIGIDDVINGVELLIGDRVRANKIRFNIIKSDSGPLYVEAGPVRLEQVLVNLIQNACDAIKETQQTLIEMRVWSDEKHVYLSVSDNGPGIDKDIQSEIFTPFFTLKPGGLGIGLGIAKDIMNEFSGSIELAQPTLGGATFELRLKKS